MKTTSRAVGLIGTALICLALSCEEAKHATAPALSKMLVARDVVESRFITIDVPGAVFTESNDINPQGDIVGRYGTKDGKSHGYLLHEGTFTTIDFSPTFTGAVGINSGGDIVGRYQTADGKFHGFLLSDGTFTSLDVPGATATSAFGINPQGDIVGGYCAPGPCPTPVRNGLNHGFLLRGGTFSAIDVPGALLTQAWKINAAGQVAGRYQSPDGQWHAFLMSADGAVRTIDVPGAIQTVAFPPQVGMNAIGDVVSSYCVAAPCPLVVADNFVNVHGFLLQREDRDQDGHLTTIDFPGASGGGAFGINARGDIVGAYVDVNHNFHGFLRSSENAPVPVSGTFRLVFEPVNTRQVDGNTIIDFTFREEVSGSIAGVRVGTGTLVVHPDGSFNAQDAGVFTGNVAGVSGTIIVAVQAAGTFASFTATARFDPNSGTGGLKGLRGSVAVTGSAIAPTTLAGSYSGQLRFEPGDAQDE